MGPKPDTKILNDTLRIYANICRNIYYFIGVHFNPLDPNQIYPDKGSDADMDIATDIGSDIGSDTGS